MSKQNNQKVLIMIPSLNPPKEFLGYVDELIKNGFKNILVINDGSDKEYDAVFKKIEAYKEIEVLTQDVNKGKGRAIKDGLKYFQELKDKNDFVGVITVDCDGQHTIKDVKALYEKMKEKNGALYLGCRNFDGDNVPKKSSFGNKATSNIFKLLYGVKISDTQTGLRGITTDIVESFIDVAGERYEYETNMLIECILKKIEMIEVPIETVYINNNSGTHFRPVRDSILIYWKILNSFIKYSAISIISAVIDIVFFKIFFSFLNFNIKEEILIIIATILARVISSFVNFILNKKVSFNSNKKVSNTILKYYTLCVVQMLISGISVSILYSIIGNSEVIIKLIVDTILFVVNYRIQRIYIFNE